MEPDLNGNLQGVSTGKGGARWLVIVVLLLLFAGFMAWFWWSITSEESQRQGQESEDVAPTQPISLGLDGLTLVLSGEQVSRVDLTPAISQLVQDIYDENKQKEATEAAKPTSSGAITQIFNTQGSPQKLSISGQLLGISDGNTVTLPSDGDGAVGNEVLDVISGAGLQRSGAGTAANPFKVGLATCASGEVLQSSGGGAWVCAVAAGTTYTADGQGIELVGTEFQLELNGTSLGKSASGLNLNLSNANTWGALQTFGAGLTLGAAQTLTVNGDAFTDLTGTGLAISGGALQTTLGTSVDLASEVNGILPVTNGGTGTNTAFTQGSIIFAGASGVYAQDNANFFWDDTNNRLGLGTAAPNNRLTINGDFNVRDADTATKQYRFRTSGGALDIEGGGADIVLSAWSNADFTGTQRTKLAFESGADITQAIKLWQFRDGYHGALRHFIDGSVGGNVHFNDNGEATNVTIEGDTDAALVFVQGSTDRVAIGGLGPSAKLHISSDQAADLFKVTDGTATAVDVMRIADEGGVTFRNRTDSTGAFSILNAASSTLFNVDSTNTRVGVGGVASFSLFEVIGGDAAIYNNGNNPRLILGDSTAAGENGYLQWDSTNNYFRIESVGTNGLKINDNFVTIGNVFPDRPLRVANGTTNLFDISTTGQVTSQNSADSTTAFRVLGAGGAVVFTIDTTNNAVKIGNGDVSPDATPGLIVLDHKSTAGDPTGTNGGMYYNASSGKFRCYEGSQWKDCLGMSQNITFNGTNSTGSASQWVDMPAALTEFAGQAYSRIQYDLSGASQARLQVNNRTAGSASAEIRIQYSTDQVSWEYIDGLGGGGLGQNVSTTGLHTSSWTNIDAAAKGDVYLRVVGINGDGVADPNFGLIQLQVR